MVEHKDFGESADIEERKMKVDLVEVAAIEAAKLAQQQANDPKQQQGN